MHHRVEYIPEGYTVSHRWTRVAAGVAEAIDHTRTVLHATRSFKAIRDSVRITASIDCALGVLSISSGKGRTGRERGRTSVHLRVGGKRNSGRHTGEYITGSVVAPFTKDHEHDPFTYALGPTMWREREWRESCARVNTVTRVRIVYAYVPLRLRTLIFTQISLGDRSIFHGLLNILRIENKVMLRFYQLFLINFIYSV